MSQSRFRRSLYRVTLAAMVAGLALAGGCDQGSTEGGSEESGLGTQAVSDGGFGASLTIRLEDGGNSIDVTEREGFFVTALDPNGLPLAFRRVFCESERGVAILEPSSGGVAFEHTNSEGVMSGVLGGAAPGSFILECRLEEGFNLVARFEIKVRGEVPIGFTGFDGAAGGNLGGGVIVENPNPEPDAEFVQVTFDGVGYTATPFGPIDISRQSDCDGDGNILPDGTIDPEPFGPDTYNVNLTNLRDEPVVFESVTFVVDDGRAVTSTMQLPTLLVDANEAATIEGFFTEQNIINGGKAYAGTAFGLLQGTYNVSFTIRGEALNTGEEVELEGNASFNIGNYDRCGS